MDYLSIIKHPIEAEIADFISLFNQSLSHEDGLLGSALEHIRKRAGKRMRPMLILLMAKNFGQINHSTQNAAVESRNCCIRLRSCTTTWWTRARSVAVRHR